MGQSIVQVDAFTDVPFTGNSAAVCLLERDRSEQWMQLVAREMNLAETAFLTPQRNGFQLRWFTPAIEVDLCGHATLASAHVLWEDGILQPGDTAEFHTRSGRLTATRADGRITLNFPAEPPTETPCPEALKEALGVPVKWVGRNRMDYIVEVESEHMVRTLEPNHSSLKHVLDMRGVIVTSRSGHSDYDFVSRFFAPAVGVDEDPVTGSAHCCLGPYWQKRLGKDKLVGYQASARGGTVGVHVIDDRVLLIGQAVTVLRCTLYDD